MFLNTKWHFLPRNKTNWTWRQNVSLTSKRTRCHDPRCFPLPDQINMWSWYCVLRQCTSVLSWIKRPRVEEFVNLHCCCDCVYKQFINGHILDMYFKIYIFYLVWLWLNGYTKKNFCLRVCACTFICVYSICICTSYVGTSSVSQHVHTFVCAFICVCECVCVWQLSQVCVINQLSGQFICWVTSCNFPPDSRPLCQVGITLRANDKTLHLSTPFPPFFFLPLDSTPFFSLLSVSLASLWCVLLNVFLKSSTSI